MKVLVSPSNDPYFNIAAEEYLLHNSSDGLLFLYVNESSVIVGKHQNTLAEISYRYIVENNIPVVRRISGGGTVFHDPGNLNFAFFSTTEEGKQIDFERFSLPILKVLHDNGITASREGKNDLRHSGLKISGNAGHVFKNQTLHHGTLLVNANMEVLHQCLKVKHGAYHDKAVQSIRSSVINLGDINPSISVTGLIGDLTHAVNGTHIFLDDNFLYGIQKLISEKFQTWEWNYAYSPAYTFISSDGQGEIFRLRVEKGIITSVDVMVAKYSWAKELVNIRHSYNEISIFLSGKGIEKDLTWSCF